MAGEDLAWPIPLAVFLAALTSSGAAAAAWSASPSASVAPPDAAPSPPPRASAEAPIASLPAPSSAPAASTATSARCPRMVITFGYATAVPPADAEAPLAKLAAWLVANTDSTAVLDGHADALGNDQTNLALSRSRSNKIATVLAAHGVARSRLTTRGLGAFDPVEGEPEEAAANRRVVIHVRGGAGCPSESEEVVGP